MAGRSVSPQVNQRTHHAAQVAKAGTGKQALLAMAQWLTALAWARGPVEVQAAADVVWERITRLDPAAEKALKEARQS